jgi:lycopene cyclase domain-containing protein
MYLYLQLLVIFVIIPNGILVYLNRKDISLRVLLLSLGVLFCIAVLWDQLSVRMGIWSFSVNEIVGAVFGLPVEEYLFFFFVPLFSINIFVFIESIVDGKRNVHANEEKRREKTSSEQTCQKCHECIGGKSYYMIQLDCVYDGNSLSACDRLVLCFDCNHHLRSWLNLVQ